MESELERFHKQNTQLELNITELRQKLKATDKEMHLERQRVSFEFFKILTNYIIYFTMSTGPLYDASLESYARAGQINLTMHRKSDF